jgi:hypothetical protein
MLPNTEISRATEIVLEEWAKQYWQRPRDCVGGIKRAIEQRYPEFHDRMTALANLTISVMPLLASPGYPTDAEYQSHLQDEMHRLLPFLTEPIRREVAMLLFEAHSPHNDADLEDPRPFSVD